MSYFFNQRSLATVIAPLCVAAFSSFSAYAQAPHNHAEMMASKVIPSVAAPAPATALAYESVFARYQSYRDERLGSWRDANATVERIGGWRAYAKEAQRADTPPATKDEPAKPKPHAGHGAKP